ncbi:nitrite/sulfite reductase hemoprotein beta-component ferrodoxin domain protein [Methylobacterium sp. 4-46]|uniref:nitrite reductase n=1 Tax=unclassified Methylobacterium TaxID=2615210 RepID=UPI000152C129|nr:MULTISPECIES: nitrite reductase [Methylobacterium]ACA16894.1 nitrite/sulfite reductase hemoprotein beta-component ferrodoxin domain protein [Methylobacterium sp. 4-46]WFT82584.1 nitrite reductase [Methylobacterium nodulans]
MNPAPRRGWCPGVARPMPTGDGLLVRVHPPAGRLTAAQALAVAEGARAFGNGLIDVTARGNLQVRGVGAETHPGLAARLDAAGLGDRRRDGGPQRLTLASPLAAREDGLAAVIAALEEAGLRVAGLPAKTLVAVEADAWGVGPVEADLLVRRLGGPDAGAPERFQVGLGAADGLAWTRPVPADRLVPAAEAILAGLAGSGARRMRALDAPARGALRDAAGLAPGPPPPAAPPLDPGPHPLGEGRVGLVAELPFGRCDADRLAALAAASARDGDGTLLLTPWRGVMLVGEGPRAARNLAAAAAAAGLITDPGDPRRAIAACPGRPACASGGTAASADAARLAAARPDLARRGLTLHVSACPKGCAHPAAADLTLVGQPDGRYGVVLAGHAGGAPRLTLPFDAVLERLNSAETATDLRHAFREPA